MASGAVFIGLRRITVLRNVYGDYHMTMAECNEGVCSGVGMDEMWLW